jgi:hypothetical protein
MSRRPDDRIISDALRDLVKKIDEILRRLDSGEMKFKKD